MSSNQLTFPDANSIKSSIHTNKNDPDYTAKQQEKRVLFEKNIKILVTFKPDRVYGYNSRRGSKYI